MLPGDLANDTYCNSHARRQQEEIRALHEKEKDLQQKIKGLEREIAAHKREIKYRDDTIGEKEKKIYELKKKNQEVLGPPRDMEGHYEVTFCGGSRHFSMASKISPPARMVCFFVALVNRSPQWWNNQSGDHYIDRSPFIPRHETFFSRNTTERLG